MISTLKKWAKQLKKQIFILYFAYKDKRTPWFARLFTALVVAYAFSPIDLIPDFIPLLGYLDDILLVPAGIFLALKMIPDNIIDDCKGEAEKLMAKGKPKNWIAGTLIILLWILVLSWLFFESYKLWIGQEKRVMLACMTPMTQLSIILQPDPFLSRNIFWNQ